MDIAIFFTMTSGPRRVNGGLKATPTKIIAHDLPSPHHKGGHTLNRERWTLPFISQHPAKRWGGGSLEIGHTYVVFRDFREGCATAYAWHPFPQGDGTELPPLASRFIQHYKDGKAIWGERSTVMIEDAERDYKRCINPKKQPFN